MKTLEECKAGGKTIWTAEVAGVQFHFRRPTTREWIEFESAALSLRTRDQSPEAWVDMHKAAERLSVLCVESHTPEELEVLNEDLFGIYRPIAERIGEVVTELKAAAGKAASARSAK